MSPNNQTSIDTIEPETSVDTIQAGIPWLDGQE